MPTAEHERREQERRAVRFGCSRWLSGNPPQTMRARLTELAAMPAAEGWPDVYGRGDPVQALEDRAADLLGKPAARFVSKGVIAQQAALRTWADARHLSTVALHPLSHVDLDELNAVERLHPLRALRIGTTRQFGVSDLESLGDAVGVVTVELPLRRAGFDLPDWDHLVAVSRWCREREIPLHLDGARLWECTPFYARSLAAIADLADSVYVSFYKGLGGLAGCVLAGSDDFLSRARPWLARHGADLYATYPYVLAATAGLDTHLLRMGEYVGRATSLAAALGGIDGVHVTTPRTNAFAIYLPGAPDPLDAAHLRLAERTGVWLFSGFTASQVPGLTMAEVSVGAATAAVPDIEAVELVRELVTAAAAGLPTPPPVEDRANTAESPGR